MQSLILASSSRYRQELLARLCLPFIAISPDVDETPLLGESAMMTCERLALMKARKVAEQHPKALVIGSDQVALLDGVLVGKPGNHDNAVRQLRAASGREVVFHTALCLLNGATGQSWEQRVDVVVRYRSLSDEVIERYLKADQPYDCAGSGRIETLGITLVESVKSDDPTALVGLPLIALTSMLLEAGVELP
jgi:septum formation protein